MGEGGKKGKGGEKKEKKKEKKGYIYSIGKLPPKSISWKERGGKRRKERKKGTILLELNSPFLLSPRVGPCSKRPKCK